MSNKVFIIIIVCTVLVAAFPILIVLFSNNTMPEEPKPEIKIKPKLELKLNTEEEQQSEVMISAIAKTEDKEGIYSIKLPDGKEVTSDITTYTVTENGKYIFEVTGNNGETNSSEIIISNIKETSSTNPYIPKGFSYLEGDVNSGYVIKDEYDNEYVWIPVASGTLENNISAKYEENETYIEEFKNSVAKYYGFYIARYETSIYERSEGAKKYIIASTIRNKAPWTSVMYANAKEAANSSAASFGYTDSKTALMNSYAWDTALLWMDSVVEDYSSSLKHGNYSGNLAFSGATSGDVVNNIYDMAGNVKEWSTEVYVGNSNDNLDTNIGKRVVRGGNYVLGRTAAAYTLYDESEFDENTGFRMILYKIADID